VVNLVIFKMGRAADGTWFVDAPERDQGGTIGFGTSYFASFAEAASYIVSMQNSDLWDEVTEKCDRWFADE